MLMRILVENGVEIANQVVLEYDLVGQQMRKQGEGSGVELGELVAEALVGVLVVVNGALQVGLVLVQSRVLPVGARLLLLKSFRAAFVAFVIDLEAPRLAARGAATAASVPFCLRAS